MLGIAVTFVVLGLLGSTAAPVAAREPTAADGARIATGRCSRCHATGATGDSPQRVAPPFRDLHQDFPIEMLRRAQQTGQISGHDEMPGFDFTVEEMKALLLHIDSLAPDKPAYVTR